MGQSWEEFYIPGLNAKNSEMHAAMGLVNFKYYDEIMRDRKRVWQCYFTELHRTSVDLAQIPDGIEYNHAYFPVVFITEELLLKVRTKLNEMNVFPR